MAPTTKPQDPTRRLPNWERIIFAAILALSGFDAKSKSEIADELRGIQVSLASVSTSLAVLVTRIEEHERRLDIIEGAPHARRNVRRN